MEISAKEAMESHISISARTSVDSTHGGDSGAPEKLMSTASPISLPRTSSRKESHESVTTQTRQTTQSNTSTPLRPLRKFPAASSTRASLDVHSGVSDYHREKSPASLLSLSDYNGSEDSHTERRFLRQYEELESHCKEPFPEFITPWFLRRLNYGPCKAGDVVDLLRFLRPKGHWIEPFHISILDPYLAASLEKAIYPGLDAFNASQKGLLNSLHHFVFSAYNYAQGIFFPFDGDWEADRREEQVDALNLYVEDVIALVEFIRNGGRITSLQEFVKERTKAVHKGDSRRTFLFAEGEDTKAETEEYVFNIFLAVLGLWTVGSPISNDADVDFSKVKELRFRYDYSKNLPYRVAVMENISLIRETFGVLVTPLDGSAGGMEWVRPLHDFDASTILQRPFRFVLTRDVSRHMALDGGKRLISIFCEEAVGIEDSLSRLEGNIVAIKLNLNTLAHEHELLRQLLFSSDESKQIAFSLGLVPPRRAPLFLRLSAFPNYAAHLLSLRTDMERWKPRRFKELFMKDSGSQSVWFVYTSITILFVLILLFITMLTGTIGIWIIFSHVT